MIIMGGVLNGGFTKWWPVNWRVKKGLHFGWFYDKVDFKISNIHINSQNSHQFLSGYHMTALYKVASNFYLSFPLQLYDESIMIPILQIRRLGVPR